jgi:4-hydroxyphenylpyruvate dioxygenase-like putative hemolysin
MAPGTAYVSYRVHDVERALAELQAQGATLLGEIVPAFGMRLPFVREPTGSVIELEEVVAEEA